MIWEVETKDGKVYRELKDNFPIDSPLKSVAWIGKDIKIKVEAEKPIIFKRRKLELGSNDIKTIYVIGFEKEKERYLISIDYDKFKGLSEPPSPLAQSSFKFT